MNAQNIILFIIIITIRCDEDLKVRLGLPEYICDKDGGVKDISKDMTTIRLLGKDVNSISYKFDVNFRTIGKKCVRNQRCTLMKWKNVRDLDHYLKNYPQTKLQTGLIEINNTMFTPGLKYLINVTFMSNDKILQEKQIHLDYVDKSVRDKVTKPMASLLLLAPDSSYAYTTYFINAEVNICSNISSYYFNWELKDASDNVTVFPTKGAELAIPPDTFIALEKYTINCNLFSVNDGLLLAESQQKVNILSRGVILKLPFKKISTRTGQEMRIKAFIKDLDNKDETLKISWLCVETQTNEKCEYSSDEAELQYEFPISGTYNISVTISKNQFVTSDFCIVEVLDDVPIIEIDETEFPVNPTQGVEIQVTVYDLHTSCTLQWTAPSEEGYEDLDLTTVPGDVGELVNITTKEDLFLNELEEFSNDTFARKLDLIIPPPVGDWTGLKGDSKYLFRLIINCPAAFETYDEMNITDNFTISSSADVIIETNAPPISYDLHVTPEEGEAFLTTFNFKTQKAQDKDEPILYKFGYTLDNKDIIVWNLGDTTNCETTLPYTEEGVQTVMETCDSFGACGRTLGPLVKTTFPTNIKKEKILQRFVTKLEGEDYPKAFIEASIILRSYKAQNDETVNDFITQKIIEEINKYLNMREDVHSQRINGNELIKIINDFNSELQLPSTVLDKLVELRNKLSDESEPYMQRKLLSFRPKRASYLSLADIRNYLEISELIITTSTDPNKVFLEKENLRHQLRNYMEKLCSNMKKTQLSLELKTVIFSVEKLKRNSLNNFVSVPFEGNSWQIYGRIKLGNVIKDSKDKCIGKAIFRDYLDKIGVSYFVDILNANYVNESPDIVIFLPKNKSFDTNPKCLVYYDNNWHSGCKIVQNIAGYVKCTCKHLGYYYLDYTQFADNVLLATTTTKKLVDSTATTLMETNFTNKNESLEKLRDESSGKYDTLSYVVIGVSVIGIIILAITVRKIFHDEDENDESDTFDFPKYALLHNEELLNDVHM